MGERISGRVPLAPGSCRTGEAAGASSSQRDGDPSRGAIRTEAERMQAAFDRITHRRIMTAARRLSARTHRRLPNWSFAMDLFGLGSTYAWALCERMGIDPDATTLTPWPGRPTPAADGPCACAPGTEKNCGGGTACPRRRPDRNPERPNP